jgi:hypothetical protein
LRLVEHDRVQRVEHALGIGLGELSPLGTDHITLTGRYRIALPERLHDKSAYRPLTATPDTRVA